MTGGRLDDCVLDYFEKIVFLSFSLKIFLKGGNILDKKERKEADLHIHSKYSDGDCSIEELVRRIKEVGLKAAVLTDHDCNGGTETFLELCKKEGVDSLPGIEITTTDDYSKQEVHILGYGFDVKDMWNNFGNLFRHNCSVRHEHIKNVIDLYTENGESNFYFFHGLESAFYLPTNVSNMYWVNKARALHIKNSEGLSFADAYEKAKIETTKGGKFYYPNENEKSYTPTNEAIEAIGRTGGIAVWAHPAETISRLKKRFGSEKVARRLFEDSLKFFVDEGLAGLEVFSAVNSPEEEIRFLYRCCLKYDLLPFGGSDYHGDKPDEHKPDRWLGRNGVSYEEFLKIEEAISLCQ